MTVEPNVVRRKLLNIVEATEHLRSWLPITVEQLETDQRLGWAVERGLQVASEALFDVGAHILSAEFAEAVDEYRQIPQRLLAHDVLSRGVAEHLKGLAGFRNVLVHDYARIDLRRVHAGLERLGDLDAFVADVERWLEARSS
jgi:uncharacterized protein YutE (UPF0331/DUF86 family)